MPNAKPTRPNAIDPSVSSQSPVGLSDLFKVEFTPDAVAAFHAGGRRLDSLIEVVAAKAADIRATLREIIAMVEQP